MNYFLVTDISWFPPSRYGLVKRVNEQPNNPLHGIKLEQIVTDLVEYYGWFDLGSRIDIRCFTHDPSVKSSLKFLRKTPWARKKVEDLYLHMRWIEENK